MRGAHSIPGTGPQQQRRGSADTIVNRRSDFTAAMRCDILGGLIDVRMWPTLVVDERARLIVANRAARALLADAGDWRLGASGELRLSEATATVSLHARIASIATARRPAATRFAQYVPNDDGSQTLLVLARIDNASFDRPSGGDSGAVLVTLNDGKWRHGQCDAKVLIDTFDLTPTEARLALAMIEGHTLNSYAALNDISISTARWHLRNAFSKCNCSGQRDFIKLMMSVIEF